MLSNLLISSLTIGHQAGICCNYTYNVGSSIVNPFTRNAGLKMQKILISTGNMLVLHQQNACNIQADPDFN
jgi:hypothetical protein